MVFCDIHIGMIVFRRYSILAMPWRDQKAAARTVKDPEEGSARIVRCAIRLEQPLLGDPWLPGAAVPGGDMVLVAGQVQSHHRPVGAFIPTAAAPRDGDGAEATILIELIARVIV